MSQANNAFSDDPLLKRRKSDSNLLNNNLDKAQQYRKRTSQMAHQLNKSISITMAERQLARNTKKDDNPQEDTFYRALEIKFHHSVGSMSISPACRDVVLAGRQGLVVIDLEDPWLIPRILPHMSKWEVADVQWSPHIARESWVASTSNQKLLVWNLNHSGSRAIEHVFHAHARAISDINWSPHQPDILATCSVDTYVHLWDLREPQLRSKDQDDDRKMRPSCSFTPWNAAATQVKFNRKSEYLIASAHDKDVKIWDLRKGAVPVTSITAHSKKIYGIDWSRQNDHDIVTCSLDKMVKFWNIHTPEEEEEVIVTDTPIWRARNTPFGNGVLIMPQRTDSKLTLYSRACAETPVHAFDGHQDTVKEFVWRWKGDINGANGDDREFQLVTWSKDQNLRLWPVSEEIMKSVGHEPSATKTKLSAPFMAVEKNNPANSHSFQQEPIEKSTTNIRPSFSSATPVRLTPNSNTSTMTPYRSNIVNHGIGTGYEQTNAYREQKYSAINPLLWMQNVKTVGPAGGEVRRDATAENTYQSVAEEMSSVLNKYLPVGVKTEKINAASRTCTISLHGPWSDTGDALLRITIRFSPQYPDNSPPEFDIQKNSMISIYYRAHMAQDLNGLASTYTSQKKWCLEPCIRYLLGENMQEETEYGLENANLSLDSANGLMNQNSATATGSPNHWKGATAVDTGDSDDELGQGWGNLGDGYRFGKRESMTSERGIMVDMSAKQSTDAKVPFPRLCGGVFSGSGQLTCFFSTLRVRDNNRSKNTESKADKAQQESQPQNDRSNGEYFENTYSDFYRHPKTYEQFEEYKEIAAMSRQGKNATVLVGGTGGAFGEYAYDDEQDDIDDGLNTVGTMGIMYYKADNIALNSTMGSGDNLLYHGTKTDRITHNVVIADFSEKMPYSPWLAKEYILSSKDPVAACIHNAKVCRKHGRLDLYKVWHLAVEILRGCVPATLPEADRVITDGHQVLLDSLDSNAVLDENWQRDQQLAEVKSMLYSGGNVMETHKKQAESIATKPLQRVKWGMHPLGQKLVDALLQHFIGTGDIQTAAMLSCTFQVRPNKVPSALFGQKPISIDKSPETELDYFSLKMSHRNLHHHHQHSLRANSGPNTDATERITVAPISASYGTKSNNMLSYLWDTSDSRRLSPIDRYTDTPTELHSPNKRNLRLNRSWTMSQPKLKIPSNTAPGIRHIVGSLGSHSSALSSPIIQTPTTPLFNKEGKVLQDPREMKIEFTNMEYFDSERFFGFNHIPLMDTKGMAQRDVLRLAYADMLYRWHLLDQRAEVLRFLNHQPFPADKEVASSNIRVSCYACGTELSSNDKYCIQCRKVRKLIRCCFCHILVKGLVNFCIHCGHGGHSSHMEDWFVANQQVYCMTGCGCKCALESLEINT
ncbi:Nuclear control of ATPase protein 2 [Mucor velutinosus]|uniref:Nuclear control of ATPase protein 2 n=1 Tax=Mucor velutinosus TaxID=708070 RepID=A0AAN7DAX8_9FUNG|nr:Nuclear control of ATPase protein 2 [Mucor velutinosus]